MRKKVWISMLGLALILSLLMNLTGCVSKVRATDLMDGIRPGEVTGKDADGTFRLQGMNLALKLLQGSMKEGENKNVLLSPLSVELALAMTANGAAGQTRQEMEGILGGEIPLELLNEYLYTYSNNLPHNDNSKLEIANSIWFRDDEGRLQVEESFLQTNRDYYGASVYKSAFDSQTVKDINTWVSDHTDEMIDSIVEEIDEDAVMYLINALAFEAKWEEPYEKEDVREWPFHTYDGQEIWLDTMYSTEDKYLQSDTATGFIKAYKDGNYAFAALLPNEGVDIYDYVKSLTSEELLGILDEPEEADVSVGIPKFTFDYELSLVETLKNLGMETAFEGDVADFSSMAHSTMGNICIGDVFHKTHIAVDEAGTKAAAVTAVIMVEECAIEYQGYSVILDRPFVFMILDQNTNLPIFMGIVLNPPS